MTCYLPQIQTERYDRKPHQESQMPRPGPQFVTLPKFRENTPDSRRYPYACGQLSLSSYYLSRGRPDRPLLARQDTAPLLRPKSVRQIQECVYQTMRHTFYGVIRPSPGRPDAVRYSEPKTLVPTPLPA